MGILVLPLQFFCKSKTIKYVSKKKKLKLEDTTGSVYELDLVWFCREDQQDAGKVQSKSTSWRKRVCKNERGREAGPVRRGGSSAKRSLGEGCGKQSKWHLRRV